MFKRIYKIIPFLLLLSSCGTTLINPPLISEWKDQELVRLEKAGVAKMNSEVNKPTTVMVSGNFSMDDATTKEEFINSSDSFIFAYVDISNKSIESNYPSDSFVKIKQLDNDKYECWKDYGDNHIHKIINPSELDYSLDGYYDSIIFEQYINMLNRYINKDYFYSGSLKTFVAYELDPTSEENQKTLSKLLGDKLSISAFGNKALNDFTVLNKDNDGTFKCGIVEPFVFTLDYKNDDNSVSTFATYTIKEAEIDYKNYLFDSLYMEYAVNDMRMVSYEKVQYNCDNPFNHVYGESNA